MRLRFHPAARAEFLATIVYYDRQVPGLGTQFLQEVEGVLGRLAEHPLSGPKVRGEFRRLGLRQFPYGVIYRVIGDDIRISAVAHRRRRPGYWERRTGVW
jgi:plasmid stabilization system protein ParE